MNYDEFLKILLYLVLTNTYLERTTHLLKERIKT